MKVKILSLLILTGLLMGVGTAEINPDSDVVEPLEPQDGYEYGEFEDIPLAVTVTSSEDGDVGVYVDGSLEKVLGTHLGSIGQMTFDDTIDLDPGTYDIQYAFAGETDTWVSDSRTIEVIQAEPTFTLPNLDSSYFAGEEIEYSFDVEAALPQEGTLSVVTEGPDGTVTRTSREHTSLTPGPYADSMTLTESGTYELYLEYDGEKLQDTSQSITFDIEETNEPQLDLQGLQSVYEASNGNADVDIGGEIVGGYYQNVELYAVIDGNDVFMGEYIPGVTDQFFDITETLDTGSHDIGLKAVTEDHGTTLSGTETIRVSETDITLNNPADGDTFTITEGETLDLDINGNVDVTEAGSISIDRDGTEVYSNGIGSGSSSFSFTDSITGGTYNYDVNVDTDLQKQKSFSVTVNEEPDVAEPPTIISTGPPGEGALFTYAQKSESKTVTHDFEFVGGEESGTWNLYVSGTAEASGSFNSGETVSESVDVSLTEGNYDWYLETVTDSHTVTSSTKSYSIDSVDIEGGIFHEIISPVQDIILSGVHDIQMNLVNDLDTSANTDHTLFDLSDDKTVERRDDNPYVFCGSSMDVTLNCDEATVK